MSHELKTPLSVILGAIQLISQKYPLDGTTGEINPTFDYHKTELLQAFKTYKQYSGYQPD